MRLIDADKVVEQLQEMKEEDVCKNISCVLCKYTAECMEGEMGEKVAIDRAIEIVEGASENDDFNGTVDQRPGDAVFRWREQHGNCTLYAGSGQTLQA